MRSLEQTLASILETLSGRDLGCNLGVRTVRDAKDSTGLRIDFTYDQATPPVALEVTTVQNDSFRSASAAASQLEERLSTVAASEGLPSYHVMVESDARMKAIDGLVLDVVRRGGQVSMHYTSDDLRAWAQSKELEWQLEVRDRLRDAGVLSVEPLVGGPTGIAVSTWESFSSGNVGLDAIEREIEANKTKVEEAAMVGYQGQLIIGVGRIGDLRSPPAVPVLPAAIAAVVVVPLWRQVGADSVDVLRIHTAAPNWVRHTGLRWP